MRKMKLEEMLFRIRPEYVGNDCIQTMIGYCNHFRLYGNGSLLYHGKLTKNQPYVNAYLTDSRASQFPYSSIPEHIEREFGEKYRFTNQIYDYEKPYLSVIGGKIFQETAYQYKDGALLHVRPLITYQALDWYSDMIDNDLEKIEPDSPEAASCEIVFSSPEDLVTYLNAGVKEGESPYTFVHCINLENNQEGCDIPTRQALMNQEREELMKRLRSSMGKEVFPTKGMQEELLNAILELKKLSQKEILRNYVMIKGTQDGNLELSTLQIFYRDPEQYIVWQLPIPIEKEDIEKIHQEVSRVKHFKSPRILPKDNPNIPEEQIELERQKVKQLRKEKRIKI